MPPRASIDSIDQVRDLIVDHEPREPHAGGDWLGPEVRVEDRAAAARHTALTVARKWVAHLKGIATAFQGRPGAR